jgi:hypothetical protein
VKGGSGVIEAVGFAPPPSAAASAASAVGANKEDGSVVVVEVGLGAVVDDGAGAAIFGRGVVVVVRGVFLTGSVWQVFSG